MKKTSPEIKRLNVIAFALMDRMKHGMFLWHRRSGKTHTLIEYAIDVATRYKRKSGIASPVEVCIVAASDTKLKDLIYDRLKTLLKPIITNSHDKDRAIRVEPYGSFIRVMNINDVENGKIIHHIDWIGIDEFALFDIGLFDEKILPRVREVDGRTYLFGSVPSKKNFIEDYRQRLCSVKDCFVDVRRASLAGIISDEDLKKINDAIGIEAYLNEFECTAYSSFNNDLVTNP